MKHPPPPSKRELPLKLCTAATAAPPLSPPKPHVSRKQNQSNIDELATKQTKTAAGEEGAEADEGEGKGARSKAPSKIHQANDYLCQKYCNPSPGDGSAPNLVIIQYDDNGNAYAQKAFNTQCCAEARWGYHLVLPSPPTVSVLPTVAADSESLSKPSGLPLGNGTSWGNPHGLGPSAPSTTVADVDYPMGISNQSSGPLTAADGLAVSTTIATGHPSAPSTTVADVDYPMGISNQSSGPLTAADGLVVSTTIAAGHVHQDNGSSTIGPDHDAWTKFDRSESTTNILKFLQSVYKTKESCPDYICIDKGCQVLETAVTNRSWDAMWKKTLKIIVDTYHYINHQANHYLC
ncbi:hypothetical protein CVT25_013282 [Psilocybe cyanescens]|uniref:CxC6 like cysteine cluster associated with KDZ domain-containing protein n=1 Tax=Psilocybe cyanescens TaxID=93625 RepID=A0A409XSS3_PSICY|nr:hypothetical protein CVT25_013282 [Psilocybe cyanescens]